MNFSINDAVFDTDNNMAFLYDANQNTISNAMAQFLRSMMSVNAKVDRGAFELTLTAQEQEGKNLFFGSALCGSCHGGRNFNEAFLGMRDTVPSFYNDGQSFANIGLDMDYSGPGMGSSDPDMTGSFIKCLLCEMWRLLVLICTTDVSIP
ncbi:MAG: cytochrome c peroxidase [Saprospiraceae bacterium]